MKRTISRYSRRHGAFTLVQLLGVLFLVGLLSALLFPSFSRAKASTQRQNCDVKLKSIVLALDAFKSERGSYPADLKLLGTEGYLTDPDGLRCLRDTRPDASYNDGYVIRAPGDAGDMPVVMCPFHEDFNGGNQARLGRFTTQFATQPAVLTSGNGVQVQSIRERKTQVGYAGMPLHGGDEIRVGGNGTALITFADGSTARLRSGTNISLLQSFIDGQGSAPLYTLLRQTLGDATYTVNHGSRFDVATPAATAGARGTEFQIKVTGNSPQNTQLLVVEGKVVMTTSERTVVAPLGSWISATVNDLLKLPRFLF